MINDDYFKIIKLKTGELILCAMASDVKSVAGESHICLIEPVQIIPQQQQRHKGQVIGETFILRPWIGMSDSDEFIISTDIVLTIGDLKRDVRQQYVNYITQTIATKKRVRDQHDREEAVMQLLMDVTPGEVKIIDIDDPEDEFYFYEDDIDEES
jgi:hypothetical protein